MGIFTRVNVIRPNYGLFVLVAILLAAYAGNLSSEYAIAPTFGVAKPVLIGILTLKINSTQIIIKIKDWRGKIT